MISDKLVYVPTTSPTRPTITITAFFSTIITFSDPLMCFQYVNNWMRAGNTSPKAERQSAPNSEINNSKFGIATASKTVELIDLVRLLDERKFQICYLHVTKTCTF